MNLTKVLGLAIITTIIFTACEATSKAMASWIGHNKSELYQKMGPPERVTSDGSDGSILIYESYVNSGQQPGQVYNNGYGGVNYTTPQQNGYLRQRMFYVHSDGIIYNWRWQGF